MLTNEIKLDSSDFSHFCNPTWPHFIKFPKIQSSRRKIHSREVKTEHPEERFFKDDLFYTGSFIVCGVYSDLLIERKYVLWVWEERDPSTLIMLWGKKFLSYIYSKLIFLASDPASWPQGSILCTQLQPCDGETI